MGTSHVGVMLAVISTLGELSVLGSLSGQRDGDETAEAAALDPGQVGLTFYGDEYAQTGRAPGWPTQDLTISLRIRAAGGDLLAYSTGQTVTDTFDSKHFALGDVSSLQVWRGGTDVWDTFVSFVSSEADKWHHLALTSKMRTGEVKLYKDGTLVAETIMGKGQTFESGGVLALGQVLGCESGCIEDGQGLRGTVADFTVWDRTLTGQQVAYISANRLVGDESNLMFWWPLDDKDADIGAQVVTTGAEMGLHLAGVSVLPPQLPDDCMTSNPPASARTVSAAEPSAIFGETPGLGMLDSQLGWQAPANAGDGAWHQVDLGSERAVYAITTQGRRTGFFEHVAEGAACPADTSPLSAGQCSRAAEVLGFTWDPSVVVDSDTVAGCVRLGTNIMFNQGGGGSSKGLAVCRHPDHHVQTYWVEYSLTGDVASFVTVESDENVTAIMAGGSGDDEHTELLPMPLLMRYFRVHPMTWRGAPTMRIGARYGPTCNAKRELKCDGSGAVTAEVKTDLPAQDLTIEMWVKMGIVTGRTDDMTLLSVLASDGTSYPLMLRNPFSLVFTREGEDFATLANFGSQFWQHLALTWEHATGQVRVYKDGVIVYPEAWIDPSEYDKLPSIGAGVDADARPAALTLCGRAITATRPNIAHAFSFVGEMSDVRLWNTVKVAADVLAHKDTVFTLDPAANGLLVNFRFRDLPESVTVTDTAGGNDAVLPRPTWERTTDAMRYPSLTDAGVISGASDLRDELRDLNEYVQRVFQPKALEWAPARLSGDGGEEDEFPTKVPGLPFDLTAYGLAKDWYLVRRVAGDAGTWHPSNDGLSGADAYGTFVDDHLAASTFSASFVATNFSEYLIALGDMSAWVVVEREALVGESAGFYEDTSRPFVVSSDSAGDSGTALWTRRQNMTNRGQAMDTDPLVCLHAWGDEDSAASQCVYAGGALKSTNDVSGATIGADLAAHGGANVFVRGWYVKSEKKCTARHRWQCERPIQPASQGGGGGGGDADTVTSSVPVNSPVVAHATVMAQVQAGDRAEHEKVDRKQRAHHRKKHSWKQGFFVERDV